MKVGFVSLGCSKNLIDTEIAIGHFKKNEYQIESNPEKAEIIVINTCGFIESAKEEAINTILEMAEYKNGKCKYLIVMGCLVQRYYDELIKELPEVDLFIKIDEYDVMWRKIEKLIKEDTIEISTTKTSKKITEMKPLPMPTSNEFYERIITTGTNFAYLKIGVNSYCTRYNKIWCRHIWRIKISRTVTKNIRYSRNKMDKIFIHISRGNNR